MCCCLKSGSHSTFFPCSALNSIQNTKFQGVKIVKNIKCFSNLGKPTLVCWCTISSCNRSVTSPSKNVSNKNLNPPTREPTSWFRYTRCARNFPSPFCPTWMHATSKNQILQNAAKHPLWRWSLIWEVPTRRGSIRVGFWKVCSAHPLFVLFVAYQYLYFLSNFHSRRRQVLCSLRCPQSEGTIPRTWLVPDWTARPSHSQRLLAPRTTTTTRFQLDNLDRIYHNRTKNRIRSTTRSSHCSGSWRWRWNGRYCGHCFCTRKKTRRRRRRIPNGGRLR